MRAWGRVGATRRTTARHGVAVLLAVAVSALLVDPSAAAPKPPKASTCSLVPRLVESTVNQGLGSYAPLVRGKETLVRLYLSLPTCAASSASIALTSAHLSVSAGSQSLVTGLAPTPALTSPFPNMAPAATAPLLDSPGDPRFVVPGSALRATTTGAFTASFTATLTYSAKSSSSATPLTGSLTLPVFSRAVAGATNGLRVLVQPMGDTRDTYANQFGEPARMAVRNGMATLSRAFPVPDGVGDLRSTTTPAPGIRYTINPTLLDIGTNPYCGTAANFSAVKGQLAQFLQSWNTANPTAPADVVLGVVDGGRSSGASSGCAEGMAAVGQPLAWVRAIPDAAGVPSMTGALAALELAHTLGLVPTARDDAFNQYHSPNANADATAPNRAYNVSQRAFLADDRTMMNLSGAWNNNTTVFEASDWAFLLCKLGGPTTTECTASGTAGAPAGADPVLVMSGTTDGTAGGTSVVESYFALGALLSEADPASDYRLVQRRGATVLRDVGVKVAIDGSEHDDSHDHDAGVGVFSFALPFDTAATQIELVRDGTVLYTANRNLDAMGQDLPPRFRAPLTLSAGGEFDPQNFSNSGLDEDSGPALSSDGTLVAWHADGERNGILVAGTSDPDVVVTVPGTGDNSSAPAWSIDRTCLAWADTIEDVDLDEHVIRSVAVSVEADTGEITFGDPQIVYSNTSDQPLNPTWAPDGGELAFEMGSELHVIEADCAGTEPGDPTPLTSDDDDTFAVDPSWSTTPGDRRIAFVELTPAFPGAEFDFHRRLALIDADTADLEILVDDPDADRAVAAPSFGTTGDIAFQWDTAAETPVDDEVWLIAASDGSTPRKLTDGPDDGDPSLSGQLLAFSRPEGEQDDIFLASFGGRSRIVATGYSPEGTSTVAPGDLRLDLFLSCGTGGALYPIAVGLVPTSTAGDDATWEHDFDSTLACSQGIPTVTGVISDGFLRSDTTAPEASVAVDSSPKPPVAEIYAPRVGDPDEPNGAQFLQYDSIPLLGAGQDADDGELDDLEWFLDGVAVASGRRADLPPQPVGPHTIVLVTTDSDGNTASATRAFEVLADADRDGIPADAEAACGSDTDPFDAFADLDTDGMPGVDDYTLTGAPCVPSTVPYGALVTITPDVLTLASTGTPVTVRIQVPYRAEREIVVRSVRLMFAEETPCEATFQPQRSSISGGDLILKFDRLAINESFLAPDCSDMRATVVGTVTGDGAAPGGAGWTFSGSDAFEIQ